LDRFVGMAVFAKVVDSASFAAAARHFGMSPAMVSKHVQTLEDRLGVRLLNRTTRKVSPTEAGQEYYERAVHILAEMEDAETSAGDMQTSPRGLLRVTAPVSFSTHVLAPAVADYLVKYPEVSIDLSLDDPYVDLVDKRFDLGIRFGHLENSSLIARKLYTLEIVLCAAPAYLEKKGAPHRPADLIKHRCLIYTGTVAQRLKLWSFVDRGGREEVAQVSGRFQANSGDVLLPPALGGCGLLLAPDYLVEDHLKAGRLVRVMKDYRTQETPVYAIYPSRNPSAKTRTFIDFLAARFGRSGEAGREMNGDGKAVTPADVLVAEVSTPKESRAS
jgi:DNA-binding transcriptional LysR family regulator